MSRPIHARHNIGIFRQWRSFRTVFIIPKFSKRPELRGAILKMLAGAFDHFVSAPPMRISRRNEGGREILLPICARTNDWRRNFVNVGVVCGTSVAPVGIGSCTLHLHCSCTRFSHMGAQ
jgi:hypothetical protein